MAKQRLLETRCKCTFPKPGIGKSTFAASFQKPLFLLTEEPSIIGLKALPVAKTFDEVWINIKALNDLEELPFETLVIDSISRLDSLIVDYIISKEEKKNIAFGACCGGFGKAYERAASIHREFKAQCDKFVDKGVTIIYICHLATKKEKLPDSDDYDIYSIEMNHDKSRVPYIDDVDCVLFGRLKSYVLENDSKRNIIKSTQERILITGISDAHVSKNRYAMPEHITMSFTELAKHIPFYNQQKEN